MKKKLLVLLLVLVAVVCFAAFSASAEETHEHCVCGGTPVDAAHHSCADVTWEPLPEGTTDFSTLAAGNYYLTGDVEVTKDGQILKDIKICLNGHNITTTCGRVFGNVRSASGKLTVTDCSYDAATKTWGGTITGGTSVYGTILYTHYSSTTNIYGGNWTGRGSQNRMGGLIVVAQDGAPDTKDENGTVTLKGTSDPTKAATLNIYGGKIYGGYSGTGGNIHVMHCTKLNVYGGTITEGRAKFTSWTSGSSTTYKYGQGGNIFSDSGATIKIYGGEISNGTGVQHTSTVKSTNSVGSGGNIYANGDLFIYGGSIFGGYAQHNTVTQNGAYIKSSGGSAQTEIDGRGGNIYAVKNLTIAGGCIYDGKANGLTGGNIYYYGGSGKIFTMSGGKIWGGEANADKDAAKSGGLVNAYDVAGGSIRIGTGTFEMTGGSIGIDADGKPAGGTCYPSGSEAGNLYAGSSSITMNLSGGEIAYGNILGVNEDGTLIKGLVSKGGNIGGSAKYTYSGDIIVRDGYAVNYGGNITLFNSGNTKIQGGTISGGEAKYGGNIAMSGSGTTANKLVITGGTIKDGKGSNGANIYLNLTKQLELSNATISGGQTTGDGASIYATADTVITVTDTTINCGTTTGGGGGGLLTSGDVTLTNVDFTGGNTKYAGAQLRVNEGTSVLTMTGCTFDGGVSGSYGGNVYIQGVATITDCTFKNGNATTSGGNLSINGTAAVAIENCTFENGTAGSTGGSVYLTDNSNVTLTNCSMNGGRADDGADKKVFTYGGNLYSQADTLVITGGTFENGAAQSAGNMYLSGTTATVTGVTFKNGDATLQCDGTTNGNGGNLQGTSSCALTVTGCTFEGGKAMRGGSIAVFGQASLIDCTVGGGEAASGGGTVFVYQKGYINITGNTEIFGGKVTNSAATGGTININSFEAAEPNYIGDGVKIHSGTAYQGSGIYMADGVLALAGNVQIGNIWVYNTAETCYIDATDLNTTTPIQVAANYGAKVGISATDKSDMFTYANGLVTYDNGDIKLIENAKINFSITLGGQREHTILLTNVGEMVMTIPNMTDCTVTYNGVVYTPDENGVITVTFPAGGRGAQYIITLTNNGEEGVNTKFVSTFAFPVGHMENPDTLVIGENTATLAAGNTTGYNYTYTAEKTGTLVITMPETGWMYVINNLTTYQYGDMQAYVDGAATAEIAVTEGDELQIMVNTFDPTAPFAAPAGTITFTAKYATYVAEANGVKYESLTEALAQGGTVTLLKDVTLTEKTTIEGTVTLNLGGKTLTTYAQNGNYGFVVKGDLTIEGEGNMVVNGVYGIGVLGSLTVNGGTFTTSADSDYMIGNFGTTTISGGSFTGIYNVLNNFQGTSTVTGGTFVTAETDATGEYEACDLFANAGLTVTGGTFSKDVTEYCEGTLGAFKAEDGTYYIAEAVAEADGVKYQTLAEALAVGGEVKLLKDITLTEKTTVATTATLDLNGCTLTTYAENNNYGFVVKGDLTIKGEGNVVVNGVYGIGVLGNLTVEGGTFTTSADSDYMIGNFGTTTINGGHFTGVYNVLNNFQGTSTVTGGTFVTAEFDATGEYEACDLFANAGLTVTGGTFSKDVTEYCADYLAAFDNGDGTWYIGDAAGSQNNPIMVEWTWNEEQTEATASVTVPAGLTYHYTAYVSGMELTINGEVYGILNGSRWMPATFTVTNDTEEEATFELKIYYPIGTQGNPAELVIGENTATIAAGNNQGYFFTYTATETGALVITMPAGDWMYVINNMTTYQYGDMQWSDSDPVVNPAVVSVNEGDVLEIMVNTYNPESMWETPAGNITFTASFEGEGGSEPEGPVVGEGVTATPDAPIVIEYTAETAGVLSVTVSGTPGFKVEVYDANGETVGLPATGTAEETLTYELTAGTYTIRMVGYANWDEASATINYSISFAADEGGETEKAEYEVDYNTALVVGDNTITLLDTAITTIYAFEPTEEGTYTITAPEGAIVGYWGAGEWFLVDPMSTTNSTEWKCTGVGQAAYIGISGIEGAFTVTVEKTAEGQAPEQIEYAVYENVHTFPAGFNTLTGEETLLNVNVAEAHTAVLGTDGYYHLDSATGPVLYVDLSTDGFTIANAYGGFGANTLRGEVDGVKYDFKAAMEAYSTFEIYPLTEDLMKFIQGYGKYQGWFISGLSPFAEINEGTANADTAWMVLCRYVEAQEPEIEKFEIDVARMILGNALEFQFGVAKTKIDDKANYYALIEKTWADGTTTTETIPGSQWDSANQYWAIVYDGLAAKEMGDTFYVTIYNADGVAVSETRTDSVRAYVERAYASQSETGKTMMVDMLNYGAAAQVHFKYGTSDLANNKLTAEQLAVGTATAPTMENKQVKGDNYQGTRFILESRIQVQLAFKNMTTDMYAIYTYTDAAGTAQTVRVEGKDFVVIDGKPAGVELSALVYADARALVDVTLYNADGTVYGTATDSIESCALRSTGDVFVALMKFADSAKAHLYG